MQEWPKFLLRRPRQRHSARSLGREVEVHYPFHPLYRQLAIVVADYLHDGAHHLTLRAANGLSYLIPGWMAELEAAQIQLTDTPRISISRLLDLRAFLDSALPSASGDSPCDGGFYNEAVRSDAARPIRVHSAADGALHKGENIGTAASFTSGGDLDTDIDSQCDAGSGGAK
jgi:hypothetical protein